MRLTVAKNLGYVDVEIQLDRKSPREAVLAKASARFKSKWWSRTRVTNLMGGQWGVRFYR